MGVQKTFVSVLCLFLQSLSPTQPHSARLAQGPFFLTALSRFAHADIAAVIIPLAARSEVYSVYRIVCQRHPLVLLKWHSHTARPPHPPPRPEAPSPTHPCPPMRPAPPSHPHPTPTPPPPPHPCRISPRSLFMMCACGLGKELRTEGRTQNSGKSSGGHRKVMRTNKSR